MANYVFPLACINLYRRYVYIVIGVDILCVAVNHLDDDEYQAAAIARSKKVVSEECLISYFLKAAYADCLIFYYLTFVIVGV